MEWPILFRRLVSVLLLVATTLVVALAGCTTPTTPTPTSGLSVGATFALGPAEVSVVSVAESETQPVFNEPETSPFFKMSPQPGNKFVLVELMVNEIQLGGELDSALIFLEFSSGKQYDPPRVYGEHPGGGQFEGSWVTFYAGHQELKLFFEVAQSEDLGTARLGYR